MGLLPSSEPAVQSEQTGSPQVVGVDDEEMESVIDALSSETARTIISEIYSSPGTATELSTRTDNSVQTVHYHLEKLQDAGLIEVVETRYSKKGNEMNIYAAADEPVVVFVGTKNRKTSFVDLLRRLIGGLSLLIAATLYVFVRTEIVLASAKTGVENMFLEHPSIAFFTGGIFVFLLGISWWWLRRR